jgi:hypothetical protein
LSSRPRNTDIAGFKSEFIQRQSKECFDLHDLKIPIERQIIKNT